MDPQFSLGSADNKGILSLLSAIEQTGDNFDTDPDSPPAIKDDITTDANEFNQLESNKQSSALQCFDFNLQRIFSGLDIGLSLNKSVCVCLICGQSSILESSDQVNMIDISLQISGMKIAERIEDIVSRKISEKHSSLICNECFGVLQQIDLLEGELLKYKRIITSKFSTSNPAKSTRISPKKFSSNSNSSLGFSEAMLDAKMPMQFLATDREIERDIEHMHERSQLRLKSKLDILTETMLEDGFDSSEDEVKKSVITVFECDVCDRKFKNKSLYQKHVKIHTKTESHNCNECGKKFTSKNHLQAHLKLHFETRTFSCPHCGKDFKGKKSLLEHVSSKHNNEKKFSCSQCQESFSSRHLKNVHERQHNGGKGFICDQCGDSFSTSQGLSHHKSKHTGDYQYCCKVCGKGFNNHKLLEEHEHVHTGNKPYQCNKCDFKAGNRGSLWVHMKKHETLKPYECSDCGKNFSHSSHLVVHRRLHSGEKPYRCRLCPEGFISSNHLKRHMVKLHPSQLPFACGNCKQTFSLRRQLVSHSNKVHGGNVVEDVGGAGDAVDIIEDSDNYSLMPVSLLPDGGDGDGGPGHHDQQRLVELLGQEGVGLGHTIVLIQVTLVFLYMYIHIFNFNIILNLV